MEGTLPNSETDTPKVLETNTNNQGTQSQGNAADNAEAERLRKEADQARMRANQLENELAKIKAAEEDAKRKQLEEQQEWKELAEQERQRREQLEAERDAEKRNAELKEATTKIFAEFPDEVIEIAKEAGLSLSDTDEATQENLKAKLTKISEKFQKETKITSNNPQGPNQPTNEDLLNRMRNGDRQARHDVISNLDSVKIMKQMAGYQDQ